jgi:hypothetical protein
VTPRASASRSISTAQPHILTGEGNGPINAAVHAFESAGIAIQVRSYEERSMVPMGEDGNARPAPSSKWPATAWRTFGVGIDGNIVTASLKALVSGINRGGCRLKKANRRPKPLNPLPKHRQGIEFPA